VGKMIYFGRHFACYILQSAKSQQNGDLALILPIISHFAAGQNLTGKIT
jgi:hypothetical protein